MSATQLELVKEELGGVTTSIPDSFVGHEKDKYQEMKIVSDRVDGVNEEKPNVLV